MSPTRSRALDGIVTSRLPRVRITTRAHFPYRNQRGRSSLFGTSETSPVCRGRSISSTCARATHPAHHQLSPIGVIHPPHHLPPRSHNPSALHVRTRPSPVLDPLRAVDGSPIPPWRRRALLPLIRLTRRDRFARADSPAIPRHAIDNAHHPKTRSCHRRVPHTHRSVRRDSEQSLPLRHGAWPTWGMVEGRGGCARSTLPSFDTWASVSSYTPLTEH